MLRLLLSALIAISFWGTNAQDWTSRGKIDSRNTEIQRREGNAVVGTEFVHFEYHVSTSLVPTDDKYWLVYYHHRNQCRGRVHPEHTKCDTSCDKVDDRTHKATLEGNAWDIPKEMRKMERDSAKMARGLGMAGGPANWSSASSSYISQMIAECRNTKVDIEAGPHQLPCTHRYREYGQKLTQVKVRGEFWKKGFYRSKGVDTPINQMVSSHEGTVAELWYPQVEPLRQEDGVLCKCKAAPEPDKPPLIETGNTGGTPISIPGPGGCEYEDKDGRPVCPYEEQIDFDCIGQSLNECTLKIENKCSEELTITIPIGCELVPDDDGTQIMTCTEETRVRLPAKSTIYLFVSIEPQPTLFPMSVETKLRIACTEKAKRQPTSKTKLTLRPTADPRLKVVLSQPSGSSFFASTVTQGRLWIYKDQATREEINKVMVPGLTEGMYLNALFGLDRAGIDLKTPKYRKCLDPKLLNGATASKETTLWYFWTLESMDPKASDRLRTQVVNEAKRVLAGAPEKIDVRHVAHLALALSDSENKETRAAGLSILELPVPADMRAEFVAEGGLDVLRSLMTFGDDAEALKAIAIAKNYPGPEVKTLLEAMADWGREPIRSAAAEALKGS